MATLPDITTNPEQNVPNKAIIRTNSGKKGIVVETACDGAGMFYDVHFTADNTRELR